MISDEFLRMLRCPITHNPLLRAAEAEVARLNQAIERRELTNRGGEVVERTLDGGLVDRDRRWLYPIFSEIPTLLADEAIPLPGDG